MDKRITSKQESFIYYLEKELNLPSKKVRSKRKASKYIASLVILKHQLIDQDQRDILNDPNLARQIDYPISVQK